MPKTNVFLFCVSLFVFLGCATPEERAQLQALNIDIEIASSKVKVVKPDSANWCEAESSCTYLMNLNCGGRSEEHCMKNFQLDAVRLGGDTVVVQVIQDYKGLAGSIYSAAQVYRCTGEFADLGGQYQSLRPTRLVKTKHLHNSYVATCGSVSRCLKVEPFVCNEFDFAPARRCIHKLKRQYQEDGPANVLVFESEKFNEAEDNGRAQRGNYEVAGTAYMCN